MLLVAPTFNAFAWKIFFRWKLKIFFMIFRGEHILKNVQHFFIFDFSEFFFEIHLLWYLLHLLLVHLLGNFFFSKTRNLWFLFTLFSCSVYSAVSVLSTNKLVHNISTCTLSVMFVRNHWRTPILMYSHFLIPPWVPDPINQSTCNQSSFKIFIGFLPFSHHLSLVLCTPFILAFNPFML